MTTQGSSISGWEFLALGALLAIGGGVFAWWVPDWPALWISIMALGGILIQIGTIAVGVTIGVRRAR